MKLQILKFMLWLYENHIYEDWDSYTKTGKFFTKPVWFIRACLVWLFAPLFIPGYLFKSSKVYETFLETGVAPTPQQMKQIQMVNKQNTRNFLHQHSDRRKK